MPGPPCDPGARLSLLTRMRGCARERPSLGPARVGPEPAAVVGDGCEPQGPVRPCQPERTGVSVLPHQRLAHLARGLLESADHPTLAGVLCEAPWREDEGHRRRLRCRRPRASRLAIDAPRCAHGGRLVADVDRHAPQSAGPSPLAPNPVTGGSVSGPGRVPWGRGRSRRAEERTPWAAEAATPGPALTRPPEPKARHRRPQQVDPGWRQDPAAPGTACAVSEHHGPGHGVSRSGHPEPGPLWRGGRRRLVPGRGRGPVRLA